MTHDPTTATAYLRRLPALTDRLTARLERETDAFATRRAADVTAGLADQVVAQMLKMQEQGQ